MRTLNYLNLEVNVTFSPYLDMEGSLEAQFDEDFVQHIKQYFCGELPGAENVLGSGEECEEATEKFYEGREVNNPDIFIILLCEALEYRKPVTIDYVGKVFWVLHDIAHAENHVSGCTIYVNAYSENEAHEKATEKMMELEIPIDLTYEELQALEEDFFARFREPMTEVVMNYCLYDGLEEE